MDRESLDSTAHVVDAMRAAERFQVEAGSLSQRIRKLFTSWPAVRAHLADCGVPESALADLDAREAELALAECALRERSEAFSALTGRLTQQHAQRLVLFDQAPDGYVFTNRSGIIREANIAAAKLLVMRREALVGRLLISFVARKDTREFRECFTDAARRREPRAMQLHLRPRSARPFRAKLSIRHVADGTEGVAFHWTIVRANGDALDPLRERIRRALGELKATFAAVQATARRLQDGVVRANDCADVIGALAQTAALPAKPLEELERIALEVDEQESFAPMQ
jgi:PAS domain S-box-containing protein